ncbi:Hypothetical predicted protein [Octopus vulgaris]|uniref:DUF4371 domain-containing protein n=1 Tax=Octopus vulgaris TaxID=6645 RepID=A0AA36B196_OCTVU|nr:Hypothetical predicted protein [Octopus vulgaris]
MGELKIIKLLHQRPDNINTPYIFILKRKEREVHDSTIHNQAILLVYVRFIHEDDIREEMLFIKSLSETTTGEDIFKEVMQYFNDKNIPLTNLINIASDGAAAMTGKSQMTHYNSKKQADTVKNILERLYEFKSKIIYLSDIFKQ